MTRPTSRTLLAPAIELIGSLCAAQQAPPALEARQVPPGTQVRNAGTYHLATGTWTRGTAATAPLGGDVVYRNAGVTGFAVDVASGDTIIDEGELPAIGAPTGPVQSDRRAVGGLRALVS